MGKNQLDLEHHCFKQHYLSTTPLDNFLKKSFPDRVIRLGASQTNLRTLVISLTIVLSTVILTCLISRVVRMICRLWKTLVLICLVIPDEKFFTFYGMYDATMATGNQMSFRKYFADINSKIKILPYMVLPCTVYFIWSYYANGTVIS